MNKEFILDRIKPYLNEKGSLGEDDFNKLFYMFSKHQQYKIIDILIEANIEIDYVNISIGYANSVNRSAILNNSNKNMTKITKLTNEELCVIYQKGNKPALETLMRKNCKLVWSRVNKYRNRYKHKLDKEDLAQFGFLGLMKAAERFDSERETKFTTYSIWWIDQQILRGIADYGFTIRLPVHYFESINKLLGIFRSHPGCSKSELISSAEDDGISKDKFDKLLTVSENIISMTSLNSLIGEDEDTELEEFIPDNITPTIEEQFEKKELRKIIDNVLNTLTPREKKIVKLRFGLYDGKPRTLEQVGQELCVTRERIRQIEAKAIKRLRHPSRSKLLRDFYFA